VPTVARVKLAVALMGLVIFAAGIRLDNSRLRVIGIGFFVVAWLLRFMKPREPGPPASDS
jgi:hypothetical protein